MTEYIFIDAFHNGTSPVVCIDRTWRRRELFKNYHYNPTGASLRRLSRWIYDSGAEVRPFNFLIGWAASLTIEPEEEATE